MANAYILYEEASALDLGEGAHQAKEIFAKAAQLLEQALFIQKAAEAWGAAGRYRKAADVLKAHREYGKAALWYGRVPDFIEAAECHHLAKQYDCDNAEGDFYKKFERTEDLLGLCTAHKRYQDFFQLALSKGKFEGAVRMANESRFADPGGSDSAIPAADLLTLFNSLMAGHTWSSIGFDLHELSGSRVLPTFKKPNHAIAVLRDRTAPELRSASSSWEDISDCLQSIDSGDLRVPRQRHNISHANFFKGFGDDFLDLVVSFAGHSKMH